MPESSQHTTFQERYLFLRQKEGRLYSDEEVKCLPYVSASHPLRKEWKIRKESCSRLIEYLLKQHKPLNILEVGCGNGWLTNQLARMSTGTVTGLDINEAEIEQARRVFPNLSFLLGRLEEMVIPGRFDVIVFAASLQYFPSVSLLMECCKEYLNEEGEIHILDTHFYSATEALSAIARSAAYFQSQGVPQMNAYYFHHQLTDLDKFRYRMMYNPRNLYNRLLMHNPFPWICIKK